MLFFQKWNSTLRVVQNNLLYMYQNSFLPHMVPKAAVKLSILPEKWEKMKNVLTSVSNYSCQAHQHDAETFHAHWSHDCFPDGNTMKILGDWRRMQLTIL